MTLLTRRSAQFIGVVLWVLVASALACSKSETANDASVSDDTSAISKLKTPPLASDRGYTEVRAIVHLHSAYSHDGCDDEGLDAQGAPNLSCVARMKAALCQERIAVAFMTDHPSHMREQPFESLLYATSPEDKVTRDEAGVATSVTIACPEGQGGPDGSVHLVVGFEGTHTMGLGLRRHLADPADYSISFKTKTPSEDLTRVVKAVKGAGGMVAIAHSEQDDIDAATIAQHDVSAMEIYNFHANFNEVLGDDIAAMILDLEVFLGDPRQAIPSDLVALVMLGAYPEAALEKWRTVIATRPVTAVVGSDVHENVLIPAICEAEELCSELAIDYPNLVRFLVKGGPLVLSDGERIDAYGRIFRWTQNRVRIKTGADVLQATEEALLAGRNHVVFEILGDAPGVEVVAKTADGAWVETGQTVTVGSELWVRSPDLPPSAPGATMSAAVMRTDAAGTTEVMRWDDPGVWRSMSLLKPGAYALEVTMRPVHFAKDLQSLSELANASYRWVLSNPIYVEAASEP